MNAPPAPIRIAILAAADPAPADTYLANQVIGAFDVPLILVQRYQRRSLARRAARLLARGPIAALQQLLNCRFEARRQMAFARELAGRFTAAGCEHTYQAGSQVLEVEDVHAPATIELLHEHRVNTLLQNGAGIIRPALIRAFPNRILNVHHGWLPAIRGCHSIAWGLLENRPDWIGVSVHLIDEGLDTGAILARERIPALPGDNYASLFFNATVTGGQLLVNTLRSMAEGDCVPIPPEAPGEYRPAMTRRHWQRLAARSACPCPSAR